MEVESEESRGSRILLTLDGPVTQGWLAGRRVAWRWSPAARSSSAAELRDGYDGGRWLMT